MGIVKLPDRPAFFREPVSLDENRYRGGKLTRELNRPAPELSMKCVFKKAPVFGWHAPKKKGRQNAGPSLD
jgi:hypothetical protein